MESNFTTNHELITTLACIAFKKKHLGVSEVLLRRGIRPDYEFKFGQMPKWVFIEHRDRCDRGSKRKPDSNHRE